MGLRELGLGFGDVTPVTESNTEKEAKPDMDIEIILP